MTVEKPTNRPNVTTSTESESKASEHPVPGDKPEAVVEQPKRTKEAAAKAVKQRQKKR